MAANYDEVRLVFDRYMKTSLKEQMRTKRTKGKSTYYHVKDITLIQNISLKDFLADIWTKAELTEYLADKIERHSRSSNNRLKKIMVPQEHKPRAMLIFQTRFSLIAKKRQTRCSYCML